MMFHTPAVLLSILALAGADPLFLAGLGLAPAGITAGMMSSSVAKAIMGAVGLSAGQSAVVGGVGAIGGGAMGAALAGLADFTPAGNAAGSFAAGADPLFLAGLGFTPAGITAGMMSSSVAKAIKGNGKMYVVGGAVIGGVTAVAAAPYILVGLGFTPTGIAAGSFAAKMMSSAAIANGGGVAAGSLVPILQSAGAVGLSAGASVLVGVVGAVVGGAMGAALADLADGGGFNTAGNAAGSFAGAARWSVLLANGGGVMVY